MFDSLSVTHFIFELPIKNLYIIASFTLLIRDYAIGGFYLSF